MVASSFFRYTLLLLTFFLGCLAPDPADTDDTPEVKSGFSEAFKRGAVPEPLMTSIDRLVNHNFLQRSYIKYWTWIKNSPEHQRRLNNHLYYDGEDKDPLVLPLGVSTKGDVRIGAIFVPNSELAEFMMQNKRLGNRPKGWETMNGMTLYDLQDRKEPKVVGVLRFKLSITVKKLLESGMMKPLSDVEYKYGVQVKRVLY